MSSQEARLEPPKASRAHQHPRALQLIAVQRELQVAFFERRVGVGRLGRPSAMVPNHNRSAAILALGNDALEIAVFEGMILDLHGQTLDGGIERGPFGHGPREQHAIPLQAKIVMQVRGLVLLNDVEKILCWAGRDSASPDGSGVTSKRLFLRYSLRLMEAVSSDRLAPTIRHYTTIRSLRLYDADFTRLRPTGSAPPRR